MLHRIATFSHGWGREQSPGTGPARSTSRMQRRRRGRASRYSPSAGSAASLVQRPRPPQRGPARRGDAPGEASAGPSAGSAQVTQRGHHRLRPLPCHSPSSATGATHSAGSAVPSSPASHAGTNQARAFAPRESGYQWPMGARGGGRRAGRRCRTRRGRSRAPFLRRSELRS